MSWGGFAGAAIAPPVARWLAGTVPVARCWQWCSRDPRRGGSRVQRQLRSPAHPERPLRQRPVSANQRIVDEGFEQGEVGLLVIAEHAHRVFGGHFECALDSAYLHGVDEHAGESERYFFRELGSVTGDFEAVAEVDVYDLAGEPVE